MVVILGNASIHMAKKELIKYEWLPLQSYSPAGLEGAISKITSGFRPEYKLTFC